MDVEFVSKDWWIIFLNCLKEFENENMIVFYLYADMPHDSNQQLVFFTLTVIYLTDKFSKGYWWNTCLP